MAELISVSVILPSISVNDPSDPNNYRGITITNSLGKLFNRILDNRFG
jgi:hypothetical protein